MKTFLLAVRNLLRNRRRSLTTLLAMVIGLVAILLFGGYRSSIVSGMQTIYVQRAGHLQVQKKDYYLDGGDNPAAYGIPGYQRIVEAIRRDAELASMITVVTPTLQLGGIAGNFAAGISRSVLATGLVADETARLLLWNDYGVKSYAEPLALVGTHADAVVVGTGVARKLRLCNALKVPDCTQAPAPKAEEGEPAPADIAELSALEAGTLPQHEETRIEMLAATAHGAPNVASLTAVKAENKGLKALDDVYLAMHLSRAQKLIYGTTPPQVTAILVQLRHTDQIPKARARLEKLLAANFAAQTLEVHDFAALNPMYDQSIQFMNSMFGFIAVLIAVIVLFMIGNTMSTAVVERTVEIGTLRAMGLRRSGIRRLFMCEGIVLGVLGSALGVLVALSIGYLINHSGWSWVPPGYSYAYLIQVRIWDDKLLLFGSVFGLIAVTAASAWWPANRAAKLMIVDALRHV